MELLFKALADPTRLRLIHLIGDGELCVRLFVEVLNVNQPKISRHLAYLRRAGLVSTRRQGKWIYYRLVEPGDGHRARIFQEVRELLTYKPEMQADKLRLQKLLTPQVPEDFSSEQKLISLNRSFVSSATSRSRA